MRLFNRITRKLSLLGIFAIAILLGQGTGSAAESSYLTLLVPGALGTFPMSVNNSMSVTGYYLTSPTTASAFIRLSNGTFTTFSLPGALWTESESINDLGDVTGFYEVQDGLPQGFIRYANGHIVTIDPPTTGPAGSAAQPVAINQFGAVAGNFPWPNAASAGFVRSRTGSFTAFTYSEGASYPTGVLGMNSSETVVGYTSSLDPYSSGEGFLLHANGYLVKFSVPVGIPVFSEATIAEAINGDGVIAGWYSNCSQYCSTQKIGGFVRSPEGEFTIFDVPGTLVTPPVNGVYRSPIALVSAARSVSLNASGFIAGTYRDTNGIRHGFVRAPYGTITSFDPPRGTQTSATGINDAGVVTGSFYYDWNLNSAVGFLRIPQS